MTKPDGPLKKGWTTGACATAAIKAAYTALLTGAFPDPVAIVLPRGERPSFALATHDKGDDWARAGIIKDAGDDPDVTHGAEIVVTVTPGVPGSGVSFQAGDGVGTVTLPGLALAVGEPAINPKPRDMITAAVQKVAADHQGSGDVVVTVAIPGGEALAKHTMNGRLGILGGLSVLGTTGVVVPYSCSAWIHAIHRGIDVARAGGLDHIAAATGSTSEAAVRAHLGLPDHGYIDMGDFVGGLLKYLRDHPVAHLTLAGGFAKLAKMAKGAANLHSSASQLDKDRLAEWLIDLGAAPDLVAAAREANTGAQVLTMAQAAQVDLGGLVARRARESALATLAGETEVTVLVYDRQGQRVGESNG